jgi:hypothetical protein
LVIRYSYQYSIIDLVGFSCILKGIYMKNNTVYSDATACQVSYPARMSWSAVLAGALVGLGLGFLLQLFGVAISLSAYNSTTAGATTIAIGGFLGLLIGVIASMGVAGFVSGYLGRYHYSHCHGGVLYGFVTWSIALLLAAIFVMPLTHYMSSYNKTLAPKLMVSDSMSQNIDITTENKKEAEVSQSVVKVSPEALEGSSWMTFILFFIGALSSCIGACYGMSCCKRPELSDSEVHNHPV